MPKHCDRVGNEEPAEKTGGDWRSTPSEHP
jgi:hypothetical protein